MTWYIVTDNETGETSFAQSSNDKLPGGYDGPRFTLKKANRQPSEFDDLEGDTIKPNKQRKAKAERRVKTLEDRVEELEDIVAELKTLLAKEK